MAKLVQIAGKRHGSLWERDTNGVSVAESASTRHDWVVFFYPAQNKRRALGEEDKKRHSRAVENPLSQQERNSNVLKRVLNIRKAFKTFKTRFKY